MLAVPVSLSIYLVFSGLGTGFIGVSLAVRGVCKCKAMRVSQISLWENGQDSHRLWVPAPYPVIIRPQTINLLYIVVVLMLPSMRHSVSQKLGMGWEQGKIYASPSQTA